MNKDMKKKQYVKPSMEVVKVDMESHLLDLSVPIGEGGGPGGGGQAKQYDGFDDDSWFGSDESSADATP